MGSAGSQAGVHRLSMTHVWEAAKFDDACTVPTPCLLLSEANICLCMQLIGNSGPEAPLGEHNRRKLLKNVCSEMHFGELSGKIWGDLISIEKKTKKKHILKELQLVVYMYIYKIGYYHYDLTSGHKITCSGANTPK